MLIQVLLWLLTHQVESVYIGKVTVPSVECASKLVIYGKGTDQNGKTVAILNPDYILMSLSVSPEIPQYLCEPAKEESKPEGQ